jgi:hypothetical protein
VVGNFSKDSLKGLNHEGQDYFRDHFKTIVPCQAAARGLSSVAGGGRHQMWPPSLTKFLLAIDAHVLYRVGDARTADEIMQKYDSLRLHDASLRTIRTQPRRATSRGRCDVIVISFELLRR